MTRPVLVQGVTYHGSTPTSLGGLDNVFGKHISAEALRQHILWYKRRFNIAGLEETLRRARQGIKPPAKTLFIVFHDGYFGNYEIAFPILKEFGIKATFFLTTEFINGRFRFWVDQLDAALKHTGKSEITIMTPAGWQTYSLQDEKYRLEVALKLRRHLKALPVKEFTAELQQIVTELGFPALDDVPLLGKHETALNWDMIRQMSAAGMEFGSHTHHHLIIGRQTEATAREEMLISKALIEREVGRECELFCYPNGQYPSDGNDVTDAIAAELGYKHTLYMMGPYNLIHRKTFRLTGIAFGEESNERELHHKLSARRYYQRKLTGQWIWPWKKNSL
ncbi:MAG: polysaccharide deacetylase family protein [bacterium]|nr:polysaccharide deacetylase family protein [bacterium]